jgi:hypothetical protein
MKFKTTIPDAPPSASPEAGARKMAGKSNAPDANLSEAFHPSVETVKQAEEVKGCARKAIDIQVQGDGGSNSPNGNPKKRAKAWHGVEEPKT